MHLCGGLQTQRKGCHVDRTFKFATDSANLDILERGVTSIHYNRITLHEIKYG